jgi:diguanylate cyclase (GGDEF)-like protein
MQTVIQAFQRLFAAPSGDDSWVRRSARAVLEVSLVLLGFISMSLLVSHLEWDAVAARGAAAIVVGSVYAALYMAVSSRHSRIPAAWSSVALVVLELALLAILLPILVGLTHLVVPHQFLDLFLSTANETAWGVLTFLAVVLFASRGWGRYVSRSAQVAAANETSRVYERLAHEDALTGLPNRRRFEQEASSWLADNTGQSGSVSLLMIDVNNFKYINDTFTHNIGDEVLKGIAEVLKSKVRKSDLAARLAGDEFVVVLRGADQRFAQQMARRLMDAVRERDWTSIASGLHVSISVGCSTAAEGESLLDLVHRSDQQMYAVKAASRTA